MAAIWHDTRGNYQDYVLDGTSGKDVQLWMSAALDPRALSRVQELDACDNAVFLSFEERVSYAESDAALADAVAVIDARVRQYRSGQNTTAPISW